MGRLEAKNDFSGRRDKGLGGKLNEVVGFFGGPWVGKGV